MTKRLLPMGPSAVLVTGVGDPARWALAVRALDLPGVVDVVPAAETVLVTWADAAAAAHGRPALDRVDPMTLDGAGAAGPEIRIPVRYDGADLAEVAAEIGLTPDEVVARHCGAEYVAAFCGFSPGFAYLRGLPAELHLPRRRTPRTRVPPGSVAIADRFSAVYPRQSPGGWHLLGTTEAVLFDPRREPPAAIAPGTRVRFVPT